MGHTKLSVYLSYLLRHNPGQLNLEMDHHGWVDAQSLIDGVNGEGKFTLTRPLLETIVAEDNKGRYRFSPDGSRIKACQGHSLPWVEPELQYLDPPAVLYHGTTAQAYEKILASGAIARMSRHAVHMQQEKAKAWQSAKRWKLTPVILQIDAQAMAANGFRFGVSDNEVWCVEEVPVAYITAVLKQL
jgi:putative RNA 2'-phosphotransferase